MGNRLSLLLLFTLLGLTLTFSAFAAKGQKGPPPRQIGQTCDSLRKFCATGLVCINSICQVPVVCGDGTCSSSENCTSCASDCGACPRCGDGKVNQSSEQCDDGNTASNDGCSSSCKVERCGDGIKQTSEQCDDSNTNNNDGCSSTCKLEICGDGIKQTNEQCDGSAGSCTTGACRTDCSCPPPPPPPACPDGLCNGTETCSTCEVDCGPCITLPVCGDWICNGTDTCGNCPQDCGTCPSQGLRFEDLPCKQPVVDGLCELDLPTTGSYQNPAWSRDSRYLVVSHFPGGYNSGTASLEVINLMTGEITAISTGVNLPGNSNTWDALDKIVHSHEPVGNENVLSDAEGTYTVTGEQAYVSNAFGDHTPSPITWYPDDAWEPALSPKDIYTIGRWVVFQDKFDKKILITEVHPDYKVLRHQVYYDITDSRLSSVKQPVWSPDGRHIIYQGITSGNNWKLQIVDVPPNPVDISAAPITYTRLFNLDGTDPSFSPDGRQIVYSGGGTSPDTVWITELPETGNDPVSNSIKVTSHDIGYEGAPGWSSDGQFIAFESSPGNPDGSRTSIWIAKTPSPSSPPPPPPPPPSPGPTVFYPIEDAYVRGYDPYKDTNYGSGSNLRVDADPVLITYMKFDLSALAGKQVISGALRFYISDTSSSLQDIRRVSDDTWHEGTITFNTAPGRGSVINTINSQKATGWFEVDITPAVVEEAGGLLSIGIDSSGTDGLWFYSKENNANIPELVVTATQCTSNSECAAGQVCDAGACKTTCGSDAACPLGQICEPNICKPGCRTDANCPTAQRCSAGACVNRGCGDGFLDPGEQCDDGNTVNTDNCTNQCKNAFCGDGIVHQSVEECDDGNTEPNDTCDNSCHRNSCSTSDPCAAGYKCVSTFCEASTAFDYVVVILMENHSLSDIIGSPDAPCMNDIATKYALANDYNDIGSPSEPNYIAMTCGDPHYPTSSDNQWHDFDVQNLVDRIESSGRTWKAYSESASGPCDMSNPDIRHFPFLFYHDVWSDPRRCSQAVHTTAPTDNELINDLASTSTASNFMWLTPNDMDNMHDGTIKQGDDYIKGIVPRILNSTIFTTKNAALFIVFDEGGSLYTVWAGPVAKKGYTDRASPTHYTHYSFLKTLETVWNMPSLTSNDAGASDMSKEFFTSFQIGPQVCQ